MCTTTKIISYYPYLLSVRFNETWPFPIGVASGPKNKKYELNSASTFSIDLHDWLQSTPAIKQILVRKKVLPLRPILFWLTDSIAAGGIWVFPSSPITGVTSTNSHSTGAWMKITTNETLHYSVKTVKYYPS